MADKTGIQWTNATWNPTVGCTVLSAGCKFCYAMKQAARIERMGGKGGERYAGLTVPSKNGPVWNGTIRLAEDALTLPLRWTKPRMIFVNSMSDLFHESLPDEAIDRVFAVMAQAPQHTFQILTKRAGRMRRYLSEMTRQEWWKARIYEDDKRPYPFPDWPLRNVWLGVSVEDQENGEERIPELLMTPAAVRFLSCEPLLGPVDLTGWLWGSAEPCPTCPRDVDCVCGMEPRNKLAGEKALDWVIVGGESGPHARPMHPAWARSLRDQCAAAGVPYFFKQWGEWRDEAEATREHIGPGPKLFDRFGAPQGPKWHPYQATDRNGGAMIRVGKRAAGRLLDGREWNELPVPR